MFRETLKRLQAVAGDDEMGAPISLHGLGFLQLRLQGKQRLHIWHPALPRRQCYEHSGIHDHRWGFSSRVLVGEQINVLHAFEATSQAQATHIGYSHEGDRRPCGNRPWTPVMALRWIGEIDRQHVLPGETYYMRPYVFHSTEAGGNGRVATLMAKETSGSPTGATSTCRKGITPDADFDRLQLSAEEMWAIVADVLF